MKIEIKGMKIEWDQNPRSLFVQVGTKVPMINSILQTDKFVNRSSELQMGWKVLIENLNIPKTSCEKPAILVTGQMFGSGKSAFGGNLFEF